jgi:catechol 2,3-dioxygenase-like lactoylglutathione lyase family enzyme
VTEPKGTIIHGLRQVALPTADVERSLRFYRDVLGLELIERFDPPGLLFFRLSETRLLLDGAGAAQPAGVVYFAVPDIWVAHRALLARGVVFKAQPHLIFRDEKGTFGAPGEAEWMAFFTDPDGNLLALSSREAPQARARESPASADDGR